MWYLTAFFVTSLLFYLIADWCLADRKRTVLVSSCFCGNDGTFRNSGIIAVEH